MESVFRMSNQMAVLRPQCSRMERVSRGIYLSEPTERILKFEHFCAGVRRPLCKCHHLLRAPQLPRCQLRQLYNSRLFIHDMLFHSTQMATLRGSAVCRTPLGHFLSWPKYRGADLSQSTKATTTRSLESGSLWLYSRGLTSSHRISKGQRSSKT